MNLHLDHWFINILKWQVAQRLNFFLIYSNCNMFLWDRRCRQKIPWVCHSLSKSKPELPKIRGSVDTCCITRKTAFLPVLVSSRWLLTQKFIDKSTHTWTFCHSTFILRVLLLSNHYGFNFLKVAWISWKWIKIRKAYHFKECKIINSRVLNPHTKKICAKSHFKQ